MKLYHLPLSFLLFLTACTTCLTGRLCLDALSDIQDGPVVKRNLHHIFKNKDLVLLGEQSHGDGTSFKAKIELIKYLVEYEGFEQLLFESSGYNLKGMKTASINNEDLALFMDSNMYSVWAKPKSCRDFYNGKLKEYLQTIDSFDVSGFDHQFSGLKNTQEVQNDLNNLLGNLHYELNDEEQTLLNNGLFYLGRWVTLERKMDSDSLLVFLNLMDSIQTFIPNTHQEQFKQLFQQVDFYQERQKQGMPVWHAWNYRDSIMASNLIEKAKGKKTIVWAASIHNAFNVHEIEVVSNPGMYEGLKNMGTHLQEHIDRSKMVNICFSALTGQALDYMKAEVHTLDSLNAACIEHEFTDAEHAIVDLHQREGIERSQMPGAYMDFNAEWKNHFDYMFFSKEVEAPDYISPAPSSRRGAQ